MANFKFNLPQLDEEKEKGLNLPNPSEAPDIDTPNVNEVEKEDEELTNALLNDEPFTFDLKQDEKAGIKQRVADADYGDTIFKHPDMAQSTPAMAIEKVMDYDDRQKKWKKVSKSLEESYQEPGVLGQIKDSWTEGWNRAGSNLGITLEKTIGDSLNMETRAQKIADHFEKKIQQNPEWGPPEDMKKWSPTWFARIGGGMAPQLLGGIATRAIAGAVGALVGGPIGAAMGIIGGGAYSFAQEGGSSFHAAKRAGATDEQAEKAMNLVGSVNAALEFAPIARLFDDIPGGKQAKRSFIRNVTQETITQGFWEGSTEGAQEIVQNSFLKTYDDNIGFFDNVEAAMIGGFMMGGAVGNVTQTGREIMKSQEAVPSLERMADNENVTQEEVEETISPEQTTTENEEGTQMPNDISGQDDSAGFVEEQLNKVRSMKNSLEDTFDIEARFERAGAKETGRAIKNIFSKRAAGEERILNTIKKIQKDEFSREDFTELAFKTEQESLIETAAERDTVNTLREFFDHYQDEVRQRDIGEFEFPETMIRRLQEENRHLKANIEESKNQQEIKSLKKQISQNEKNLSYLQENDIQYIHAPVRFWLQDVLENNSPEQQKKILSSIPYAALGRDTPSLELIVKSLEKKGLMKRSDVDVRDIVAVYGRYMENKLAIDDIIQSAKDDNLAIKRSQANDTQKQEWTSLPAFMAPQLKGWLMHPALADQLELRFQSYQSGVPISRLMGTVKMFQFYNPLFLPMYDIIQAAMSGMLTRPHKVPGYALKAFKHIRAKDDHYFNALRNGIASKPHISPFEKFMDRVSNLKERHDTNLLYRETQRLRPTNQYQNLKDVYGLSWNTAWSLDKSVRFVTYEYLLDKGYSSEEAAQMAARYHGDYASVPVRTRKILNKIFFTPTFKVVMGKLYADMTRGAMKTLTLRAEKRDYGYALGMLMMGALWIGRDFFMRKILGYKRDQIFRRYKKEYTAEDGEEKEHVITMSGPDILLPRFFHRYKQGPEATNRIAEFINDAKWEIHPLWQLLWEGYFNQSKSYEQIYNPFDDPAEQFKDFAMYSFTRLVPIFNGITEMPGEKKQKEAFKKFKEEVGGLESYLLRPFLFQYIRSSQNRQKAGKINALMEDFRSTLFQDPPESQEEYDKRLKNFQERVKKIQEMPDKPTKTDEEIDIKGLDLQQP